MNNRTLKTILSGLLVFSIYGHTMAANTVFANGRSVISKGTYANLASIPDACITPPTVRTHSTADNLPEYTK